MIKFRPLFVSCCALCVCLSVFSLSTRAQTQSVDDVHIVPRNESQAPPSTPLQIDGPSLGARLKPVRVDIDVVLVPVTVTDLTNRPVMDLGKQDFTLLEGNTEEQIQYFGTEDAPISVGVLVDLSGSMKNKIDNVREAVDQFFNNANPDRLKAG